MLTVAGVESPELLSVAKYVNESIPANPLLGTQVNVPSVLSVSVPLDTSVSNVAIVNIPSSASVSFNNTLVASNVLSVFTVQTSELATGNVFCTSTEYDQPALDSLLTNIGVTTNILSAFVNVRE